MKCKAKDRRSVDFFCEVGSVTGQGVMRIYVESEQTSEHSVYFFISLSHF